MTAEARQWRQWHYIPFPTFFFYPSILPQRCKVPLMLLTRQWRHCFLKRKKPLASLT